MTTDLLDTTATPHPVLDWRDRSHWSRQRRCCRYCGYLTNLRDDNGQPAHKTCAERNLSR